MREHYDDDQPHSVAQAKDWIKQLHVIYAALIGIGMVTVQPFLYEGEYNGLPARICVISFALSIPILSSLLLLNYEEEFRKRMSKSMTVAVAKAIGQFAAVTGIIAAFWHISPLAGISLLVGCVIGLTAYAAGSTTLLLRKRRR